MKFKKKMIYLGKFSLKIWPFSPFENLAFFETAYGQIWPFYFLGPGNPVTYACDERNIV